MPSGVIVAILLVPQAIAYAYLAGMPPQYGLYAALVPIVIYSLLGTTPHLAIGPVAISAILILAGVSQLAEPFSPAYIELVILAGLLIGLIQIILGTLRMGRFINLLSYPVITGFTSAAAIIVICSQLKDVLGIELPRYEYLYETLAHVLQNLGKTHVLTFGMALISFATIFLLKKVHKKIPGGLVIVTLGIISSYYFDLSSQGVEIIGFVPSGLPSFNPPLFTFSKALSLLPTVVLVTTIGIVESIGIAKAIENKNQFYEVDTNQELIALGTSKIGGAFFGALPSSGSFSRSALLHESRAKTTIASIITVFFVIFALLFLTPLLYYLPKVILAVIIIFAVKNLFEYRLAKKLFHLHGFDFFIMLVTFIVTLAISIEVGVAIGFLMSFFALFSSKHSFPKAFAQLFGQKYKKDICCFEDTGDNCIHIEIGDYLYFGNVNFFKELIKDKLDDSESINEITILCNENVDMDSSGIKGLIEMTRFIKSNDINYKINCSNKHLIKRLESLEMELSTQKRQS